MESRNDVKVSGMTERGRKYEKKYKGWIPVFTGMT